MSAHLTVSVSPSVKHVFVQLFRPGLIKASLFLQSTERQSIAKSFVLFYPFLLLYGTQNTLHLIYYRSTLMWLWVAHLVRKDVEFRFLILYFATLVWKTIFGLWLKRFYLSSWVNTFTSSPLMLPWGKCASCAHSKGLRSLPVLVPLWLVGPMNVFHISPYRDILTTDLACMWITLWIGQW